MSNESDTPTPRTDAELSPYSPYLVVADFARTLERELAAARAELADYKEVNEDKKRLAREIGVALLGNDAPAQPSLCDLVKYAEQLRTELNAAQARCSQWADIAGRHGAEVDRLRLRIAELEAQQPPTPKFLERPDAPGVWWKWDAAEKCWYTWYSSEHEGRFVEWWDDGLFYNEALPGYYVYATPPQWTPTSEEGQP